MDCVEEICRDFKAQKDQNWQTTTTHINPEITGDRNQWKELVAASVAKTSFRLTTRCNCSYGEFALKHIREFTRTRCERGLLYTC